MQTKCKTLLSPKQAQSHTFFKIYFSPCNAKINISHQRLTCFHSLLSALLKWSSFWVNHSSAFKDLGLASYNRKNLPKPLRCPSATTREGNRRNKVTLHRCSQLTSKPMLVLQGKQSGRTCDVVPPGHMTSFSATSSNSKSMGNISSYAFS